MFSRTLLRSSRSLASSALPSFSSPAASPLIFSRSFSFHNSMSQEFLFRVAKYFRADKIFGIPDPANEKEEEKKPQESHFFEPEWEDKKP